MDAIVEHPMVASGMNAEGTAETPADSGSTRNSKDQEDPEKSGHVPDAPQAQGPSQLDWDGPDDLDNPHNWSYLKRGRVTLVIGLVGFIV